MPGSAPWPWDPSANVSRPGQLLHDRPVLSVAVCTWNRAEQLDGLLTSMRDLRLPARQDWELLIVNNNCSDATDTVIRRHMPALPIIHLHEARQGISHARNTAVRHARGNYIIWTDDDVRVGAGWLEAYIAAFEEYPGAAAFGGPIQPCFEIEPPEWLARNIDRLGSYYALRDFGPTRHVLPEKHYPYGANMALRTCILRERPFEAGLGRNGDMLIGGEETRIMAALWDAGEEIIWVPDAPVIHHIPASRMCLSYLRRLQYCEGRYGRSLADIDGRSRKLLYLLRRWLGPEIRYRLQRLARQPAAHWLPGMLHASRWRGRLDARWRDNTSKQGENC
ncbi:GT2 family glycosyltransferase [Methylohalomonas lacus]|uniref:GT2 family glycosyltransferase n=1 Tax=Methylohalomonas lacus TaxID=398773 RepID=A0AAE3HJ77_9GAMM|nr:glycosyltransferase [Methylohalomonas lacus]MCS3903364.1 GT2 family glycosyltransferase [Methylohalomonas lacus]